VTVDWDLIVIGAGINGLAITRDAAVRGLRVMLLERDDLGCETTAWSSRMIHGGLRYLEQFDVRLVRESLREREILFQTASHLVRPIRIVVPIFDDSTRGRLTVRTGMVLYDLLSAGKSVPRHEALSRERVTEMLPGLRRDGLRGGVAYTDGQVELSERLCVELALDAERHGAAICTKTKATRIETRNGRATAVVANARGRTVRLGARCVVNATGPWVDRLIPGGPDRTPLVGGTKGSHIVLSRFPGAPSSTVHFETETGKPLLCIPVLGRLLVGSTDELFSGDPGEVRISDGELDLLVSQVNRLFPSAAITRDDVLFSYSGVRPLPHSPGKTATAITRRHHVHRHDPHASNLFSVVGGKLTTHRSLAEETGNLVAQELGERIPRSPTATLPLPGSGSLEELAERRDVLTRLGIDPATTDLILRRYGVLADRVAETVAENPRLGRRLTGDSHVIAAEVLVAVDQEHARTLADVIFRRVVAGFNSGLSALTTATAEILMRERDWTPAQIEADTQEIRKLAARMRMHDKARLMRH
jgi:glycerol-3-phosphate dehydrogenase